MSAICFQLRWLIFNPINFRLSRNFWRNLWHSLEIIKKRISSCCHARKNIRGPLKIGRFPVGIHKDSRAHGILQDSLGILHGISSSHRPSEYWVLSQIPMTGRHRSRKPNNSLSHSLIRMALFKLTGSGAVSRKIMHQEESWAHIL